MVLSLAAKYNRKVLITSTSEVYGKSNETVFAEDQDSILGPTIRKRWSYACSKLADEFLSLVFHEEKGLPVIIVRLFNTVGPRQTGRYGMVISNFVRQALRGEPLTAYGTDKQTRCLVHVNDVVEAMIKLVQNDEAVGQVINQGSDQEIAIEELAQLVKEITSSPSELLYIPYDKAYHPGFEDMERRRPDIGKARNLIDFKPSKSIQKIIKDVVEYIKSTKQT